MFTYLTEGVCSEKITFDVENDVVKNVQFYSGCAGNVIGISKLIEGMNIHAAIKRLKGINCRDKGTSCPDQLARALEKYISE
jgi:uncharacterized protein (TIGR03905 family)